MDAETTIRLEALEVLGVVRPEERRRIESLPPEKARREMERLVASLARSAEAPGLTDSAAGGLAADILATPPTVAGSPEALRPGGDRDQSTLKLRPGPGVKATRDLVAAPTIGGEGGATAAGAAPRPAAYERLLGPYGIVRELGRGAMGVVYLAEDRELRRLVALKVLPRGVTDDTELLERFRREASACASLSSPHIVSVMGMGQAEDLHYYAMEYVEGKSLADVIAKERITPERAAVLARQAAEGLGHAHAKGVIHRDVKPANMIVTCRVVDKPAERSKRERLASKAASTSWRDSEVSGLVSLGVPRGGSDSEQTSVRLIEDFVKVADFGLARVEGGKTLTATGHVMGTPAYMAPEQARGAKDEVGPASDVYSLGATLYEMLTGKRPFDADDMPGLMKKIIYEDPPRPRSLAPTLDRDLETIALKCLEKDPSKRYTHAGKLAEELGRWLRDEPIHARPVRWPGRVWRRIRRNRAVAGLTAGLLVCVLAVIGVTLQYTLVPKLREAARQRQEAQERAERKAAAEALFARAQAASDGKRPDEAARLANELLGTYAAWAEKGEELPISNAHALLGDVHRAKDESKPALVEFYRAFEAAIGTPRAAETLVRVGDQLYDMEEFERAQSSYEKALELGGDDRLVRRAQRGLALCLLSTMRFDDARRAFAAVPLGSGATAAERRESTLAGALLSGLSPPVSLGVQARHFVVADLFGDRMPDLVTLSPDGQRVAAGRVEGTTYREIGRTTVAGTGDVPYRTIDAFDLDDDGSPEIAVAGGTRGAHKGRVAVLRWSGEGFRLVGTGPVDSDVPESGLSAADVDGDGSRELLLGTGAGLSVYRLDEAKGLLHRLKTYSLGGGVDAIAVRDADRDGLPEVWAFAGSWSAFSLICLEWNGAELARKSTTPMAAFYKLDPRGSRETSEDLLCAGIWWDTCLVPQREIHGARQFEERFRRPGIYCVEFGSDLTARLRALWELPWTSGGMDTATVCEVRWGGERFAWAVAETPSQRNGRGETGSVPFRVFHREGKEWIRMWTVAARGDRFPHLRAADVDGDGDDEILSLQPIAEGSELASVGGTVCVLGLQAPEARLVADERASPPGPRPTRLSTSSALVAAMEAERLQLPEEAANSYEEVLRSDVSAVELDLAATGLVRSLVASAGTEAAASRARALVRDLPAVGPSVLATVLDSAEAQGAWTIALAAAEDLASSPGVGKQDQTLLYNRVVRLRRLAHGQSILKLPNPDVGQIPLLATAPCLAAIAPGGSLIVWSPSDGGGGLFVPLAYDGGDYRLKIRVRPKRLEWGTQFEVGLVAGPPWDAPTGHRKDALRREQRAAQPLLHSFNFNAMGETWSPLRSCEVMSVGCGRRMRRRVDPWILALEEPFEAALEYVPHQSLLRWRFEIGAAPRVIEGTLAASPLEDESLHLVVAYRGAAETAGYWGECVIEQLELVAGSTATTVVAPRSECSTDLLFQANGKWILGARDESLALYDRALAVADAESAGDARVAEAGMPSPQERPWALAYRRWTSVDARFWRGLARAETMGPAAGVDDLRSAWSRSPERCRSLLLGNALPLKSWNSAGAVIRELLLSSAPQAEREPAAFGPWLLGTWGADVADLALGPVRQSVARYVKVKEVGDPGGADGLRVGDILLEMDGGPVRDRGEYRRGRRDALDGGRQRMTLRVRRDGAEILVTVDPGRLAIVLERVSIIEPSEGER